MVQINLLPLTVKAKRKIKIEFKLKLGPAILALVGVMLVVIVAWAMLGARLVSGRKNLSKLDEHLVSLQSTLKNLDALKKDKGRLLSRLEFMDRHLKRTVSWARNLNQLSELVPAGIWLKSITLHTKKKDGLAGYDKMAIKGSAIPVQGQEAIDSIGDFMNALKQDEVLSGQISEIKLISSQRSKRGGKVDVMEFSLSCQFK